MSETLNRQTVLDLLAGLKRTDRQFKNFGAIAHQYELHQPLSESALVEFESKHEVALPEDYRYFIARIGNGGAGPYYGLFPLGYQDSLRSYCTWDEGDLVGNLSAEFPHEHKWNLPDSFWDSMPDPGPEVSEEDEDRMMEEWDQKLEAHYWNPTIMNGAIPICHLGCAMRHWLVIHGSQRGFVWVDDRADDNGISPLRDGNDQPMTFADWYMSWLRKLVIT